MYITVMKCCAGLKGSDTKDGTKNKINLEDVFISIISDPIVENSTFWQIALLNHWVLIYTFASQYYEVLAEWLSHASQTNF